MRLVSFLSKAWQPSPSLQRAAFKKKYFEKNSSPFKTSPPIAVLIALIALTFIHTSSAIASPPESPPESAVLDNVAQATIYYVSKKGNNQNGGSWQTAWNELDQINWPIVKPGDIILIDGGSIEMTYTTAMEIGASGESNSPIRVQAASEPGRNGKITIFGGRYNALPHCFQSNYENQKEGIIDFGIRTNDHSWLVLDGLDWRGIVIHGFAESGIRIDRNSENVTIRNVEIYNNGHADSTYRGWIPEGVGIRLAGPNMVVERAIIHDNGQDAIQSMWERNNIRDFRISQSWLYNGRRHLTEDESWNYCTHTDGVQIYDGGHISGVTVEDSVVGPGFTNGLILGQTRAGNGAQANVHNVMLLNTLFFKAADNGLFGYEGSDSHNWTIDKVTLHCPKTKWHCITLDHSDHKVTNSIIVGSRLTFEHGLNTYENNCIWQTQGLEIGENKDPQFVGVSESDHFSLDDYSLSASSPCRGKGSDITSVDLLLATADANPAPNPAFPSVPEAPTTPPSVVLPPSPGPSDPVDPNDPGTDAPSPDQPLGAPLAADSMNAIDGRINDEFAIEDGSVYQPVDIAVAALGGLATYNFSVSETGFYQIEAFVKAETESHNSVFINIDSDPNIDYMILDITPTQGFQNRLVAWRGNGTFNRNEFAPKFFHLNAGEHTLYIRGREAFTYLNRFSVQPAAGDVNPPVIRPTITLTPRLYLPLVGQ